VLHPGGPVPDTDAWWAVTSRPDSALDPEATQPVALDGVPLTRTGRPARAPRPAALPPARAFAGAAVAVAGVALGIGTLLWATEPPADEPASRSVQAATDSGLDEPAVPEPGTDLGAPAPAPAAEGSPAAPPAAAAPVPAAPVPAAEAAAPADDLVVPVLVLNNSRIDGLAERAARQFEAAGWPVHDTGGLRGRIRATTVYYPPGEQDSATEFARRFGGVQRVLPRLAGLPGSGLTVVVTRDFVGQ
jgi:hypothetical protein